MEAHWEKGCRLLEETLHEGSHLALARLFLAFIRTARNMTRFFELRDSLWQRSLSVDQHHGVIQELKQIARDELKNALAARKILAAYPELAFSVTYCHGISLESLDWKINHTRNLLEKQLPMMEYSFRFSRNRTPIWDAEKVEVTP